MLLGPPRAATKLRLELPVQEVVLPATMALCLQLAAAAAIGRLPLGRVRQSVGHHDSATPTILCMHNVCSDTVFAMQTSRCSSGLHPLL